MSASKANGRARRGDIRVQMHPRTLKVMTQAFNASIQDILVELLQNSRRAKATEVQITIHKGAKGVKGRKHTVTVKDDGTGIIRPEALLSYGESGWERALAHRENAAGMGMLSLAKHGCVVQSRRRHVDPAKRKGWRVTLKPEHFTGKRAATVYEEIHKDDPDQEDQALEWTTAITFGVDADKHVDAIRYAAEIAARHYPLNVTLVDRPHEDPRGRRLKRSSLLLGAQYTEIWRGVKIGIFKNTPRYNPSIRHRPEDAEINIHGIVVRRPMTDIETMKTMKDRWPVAMEVIDCPELKLVLPARKELIETPFLTELQKAAELATYRAIARDPDPEPTYAIWTKAKAAGIDIKPASPVLEAWLPITRDDEREERWRPAERLDCAHAEDEEYDVLRMGMELDAPMAQSLARAVERASEKHDPDRPPIGRLALEDPELEGYEWYDRLPRITGIRTKVDVGDGIMRTIGSPAEPIRTDKIREIRKIRELPDRPAAIRLELVVQTAHGTHDIELDADIVFAGKWRHELEGPQPLIATTSTIGTDELVHLLHDAFFYMWEDGDAGSLQQQEEEFDEKARHIATELLDCSDEARKLEVEDTVRRELSWLIRDESRRIDITVRHDEVMVSMD